MDYSRQWAVRILHEAQMHDDNCVITLTYNDANLPIGDTLVKEHFTTFMKALRYSLRPKRIRFYHCGEYAELEEDIGKPQLESALGRAHYHACIFGHQFDDLEIFEEKESGNIYTSETLSKIWGKGFVTVMDLTLNSAGYVARYICKKINGDKKLEHYKKICQVTGEIYPVQQEYATMSRKPGIGKKWWDQFKTDVFPSDDLIVLSSNSYHHVPTPKYYDTQLEKENPELFNNTKENRRIFAELHIKDNTLKRLKVREVCKTEQVKNQTRL